LPSHLVNPLAAKYIRWTFLRAVLHRGWWLVTSLYLVVEANLTPVELVFLGSAQGLAVIAFEIPTGVMADNFSRKWSIVISHLLMGIGMLTTGLVTSFPLLVLTQMLWGVSWTFSSGADVAWITDELDDADEIGKLLGISARWELLGSGLGLVLFGMLAWLTSLATAIILAGSLMLLLGCYVAVKFTETRFIRSRKPLLNGFFLTLKNGIRYARSDRPILLVLSITFLVNGADEVFSRLMAKGLLELGLPKVPEPVLWLTALGLVTLAVGAVTLKVVENRLQGQQSLRFLYLLGCLLGLCGLLLFALAPNQWVAMSGVIVVHGIAWSLVRVVGVVWMNERTTSEVRATIQSFLSQAENMGEVFVGLSLGLLAQLAGIPIAIMGAALVVFIACTLFFDKPSNR